MTDDLVFTLYVAGQTARAQGATSNLYRILQAAGVENAARVSVVDILEQPHLAEREKILATPTLVRERPEPCRRVVGDLSDRQAVLTALDLPAAETTEPPGLPEGSDGGRGWD